MTTLSATRHPSMPDWTTFDALPRVQGHPVAGGRIRVEPGDFRVEERLGFAPDGEGEHLLLQIRKTSANTEWVARRVAALLNCPVASVGYAGLKDRHSISCQWFSVPRPRDTEPDWAALLEHGIEILQVAPHRRKLRRGALEGNRFLILVRDCHPAEAALAARLEVIRTRGVPNYFGEQRFGHADGNLAAAHALFSRGGKRVSRHQRGLWLSAARAQIFNEILAERVRRGDWDRPQAGDCLQLDGSHSHFLARQIDPPLLERAERMDLHPSGPLWGAGAPPSADAIRLLEEDYAARFTGWPEGLAARGLTQERRALRLPVAELTGRLVDAGLELVFQLPAGAYATAVLREIVEVCPA